MYSIVSVSTDKLKYIMPEMPEIDQERMKLFLEKSQDKKTTPIDLSHLSKDGVDKILTLKLSNKQRAQIAQYGNPKGDMADAIVSNPTEFFTHCVALNMTSGPNLDFYFCGRWYPIKVQFALHDQFMGGKIVYITGHTLISDLYYSIDQYVSASIFEDDETESKPISILDLLKKLNLRPIDADNMREVAIRVRKAELLEQQTGTQMLIYGPGVIHNQFSWWQNVDQIPLGSPVLPLRGCVESEFECENRQNRGHNDTVATPLPFVRLFCLDKKTYVYVDVEDLNEYKYAENALERLVLPDDTKTILTTVFQNRDLLFGDVIAHKSGGMAILAHGGTGVGKTLTAEIFAESTKRPLYILELGELGVKLDVVEENLQKIFMRATRWNAILLFDECDVFLHQRGEDLERSAIVGVFLRLMDYYPGIMFLTSNRVDVLDPAIQSRLTLSLKYPDLDGTSRGRIWSMLLQLAGVTITNGLGDIPSININGRKIRNIVRLIKAVHKDKVTQDQVRSLLPFCGV